MDFTIEYEQETDGRWLAEVTELPGVMTYGTSSEDAMRKAAALALRVLAERLDGNENRPFPIRITLKAARASGLHQRPVAYSQPFSV